MPTQVKLDDHEEESVLKLEIQDDKTDSPETTDDLITVKNEPFDPDSSANSPAPEPLDSTNFTGDPSHSALYCSKCDKSFVTVDAFHLHCSNHLITVCGTYRCRFCDKVFQWNSELSRHQEHCQKDAVSRLEVIQDGDLYICPKCFKSFAIREFCITHIIRHNRLLAKKSQPHGDEGAGGNGEPAAKKSRPTMKCTECAKMFLLKSNFDRHMRTHRDAKLGLYRCKICGKDNETHYELTKHSLAVHGMFQMASAAVAPGELKKQRKAPLEIKKLF